MSRPFDYFIVFAEMRTGSNFLEANLNAMEGVTCHGEAFNPAFVGYPNKDEILGIGPTVRDANPMHLVRTIRDKADGLGGFRYFHDHDPRILDECLKDRRCAKIILTRNPIESYVSWKIAQATDQWKLTDVRKRRARKIDFKPAEFEKHMERLQAFQVVLLNSLQETGQTGFYVAYEDLQSLDVMNGLATYLGVPPLEELDSKLKRQNPEPLENKVTDFDGMASALARMDRFNLTRTPNFEPRRGPSVPSYIGGRIAPLLYMPIRGGPEESVTRWLAEMDDVTYDDLPKDFNQRALRHWRQTHPRHRAFTVVRHPVARAHRVFCRWILPGGKVDMRRARTHLRNRYNLPIPADEIGSDYTLDIHRTAFKGFLEFVRANLSGQTALRTVSEWAAQATILQGFGEHRSPDMVIRETEMMSMLPILAAQIGRLDVPEPVLAETDKPYALSDVYDAEAEELTRAAYGRDYDLLAFEDWDPNT